MANLDAYINFSVKFDLTGSPKLVLTDPNNYPAGVHITGIFSVTQPDCITQDGDWNNPDVVWISGDLTQANKPLRPSTNKKWQTGNYTIVYTVTAAGYTPTTFTRTFHFDFEVPTVNLKQNFDVFTPDLNVEDITVYQIPNYTLTSSSNSWSAQIGTVGMLTATNTNVFDLRINNAYYDATYDIVFSKTTLYTSATQPWLTVLYLFGAEIKTAADTPPQMDVLVGYLTALKALLDATQPCERKDGLKQTYIYAESILAHTQMRLCSGDMAVEDYVNEFIKLTHNGQIPAYTNTNSPIAPYVLTFCKSGAGSGVIAHISITEADFEPDGKTYLNPLCVPDNVSIFWSDTSAYIYQSNGQWQYVTGGVKILDPAFDASANPVKLELSIKRLN